ncbi:MAG: 50S ribosomal protein L29 [Saprospiraceae bacterium]|nr:50S ribosomal protein L29 [Saprospiraceae bacterium]
MAKEKLNVAEMTDADLVSNINSLELELQQMKFDHAVRGLGNPMEIRELRRNIARINTEIRAREVSGFTPAQLELRSKLRARRSRQK